MSVKGVRQGVAEIGMLSVDPDLQGQGLGAVLLSAAEARAESFGALREGVEDVECRAL